MLFAEHLCLIRGGGDLGTGVALRLSNAGFPVTVCELPNPLTVRRTVALSTAVADGTTTVEGLTARRIEEPAEIESLAATGVVPVLVASGLPKLQWSVVVDARMAKQPLDTNLNDAPLVVALGPGFSAGEHSHAVVETMRGPDLGRVLWEGSAKPDTGQPSKVEDRTVDRVLRAPVGGTVVWNRRIGDSVITGEVVGTVGGQHVTAKFDGLVRGLILDGIDVAVGTKIGDVDPRGDKVSAYAVSDKALAVGAGALEAILTWLNRSG